MEMPLDSPWMAWDSTAKHSISAQPLKRNAATGNLEAIAGQKIVLGSLGFRLTSLTVTFPGLKTSPMTVVGVRLFHSAAGAGWEIPEHPINATFPEPIVVPAGRPLTCLYSMPLLAKGKLRCEVGLTVVTGVIEPAPTPTPTTTPTPVVTTSPNGTIVPPAAQIVDATQGVWTLGTIVSGKQRQILLNGKVVGTHAETLEISAKGIFAWNSNNGYSMWSGTAWVGGTP